MICNNCGKQIADGTTVCPFCGGSPYGAPAAYVQPQAPQPAYVTPEQEAQSKSVLTFGILALAFACSFFLSFMGIIFGAIGLGKANNYNRAFGMLTGRAKTGHILAKVGLIVGIVMTVLFVIWLIAMIIAASEPSYVKAARSIYSYYY